MPRTRQSFESGHHRKFLVIIDETPECDRAVYYASRRAVRTGGRLVMLAVVATDAANQQWLGVGELMRAEARDEVQKRLDHFAARARNLAGIDAEIVIREGQKAEQIQGLIEEDSDIGILVLATGTGNEGPGPLVSSLASSAVTFTVPITIVPGQLSDEELDALA